MTEVIVEAQKVVECVRSWFFDTVRFKQQRGRDRVLVVGGSKRVRRQVGKTTVA
jgi:hypothetical protein